MGLLVKLFAEPLVAVLTVPVLSFLPPIPMVIEEVVSPPPHLLVTLSFVAILTEALSTSATLPTVSLSLPILTVAPTKVTSSPVPLFLLPFPIGSVIYNSSLGMFLYFSF